jgi:hypothetical protein
MRSDRLTPVFAETMPDTLEDGVLYVSVQYAMTIHRCACGCGHEVVAPLAPSSWIMTFDGVNISLEPSIGNWNFPCRSHYWVLRGRVLWAGAMSQDEIDEGGRRDTIPRSVEPESFVAGVPDVRGDLVEAAKGGLAVTPVRYWWRVVGDRFSEWWKH